MNTKKIVTLYPYFLDALRQLHTGRCLKNMMANVEMALSLKTNMGLRHWVKLRDRENTVLRFDEMGLPSEYELNELVSPRQFAWVCQQMPPQPTYSDDLAGMLAKHEAEQAITTGWQATAHAVPPPPAGFPGQTVPATYPKGQHLTWVGSEFTLATLLRGARAIRAKRHKHTHKLIAQLWAYHLLQCHAQQPEAAAEPVVVAVCAPPSAGLLPRLATRLRRGLATKLHQVAVAAEVAMGEGAQVS